MNDRIEIEPRHREIVAAILHRHVPRREVWVFGSRTTGQSRPYSDLDLAIGGDIPLSLAILAALSEDFENSLLPFKVDVVDWATAPDSFRQIIAPTRILLQKPEFDEGAVAEAL